MIDQLKQKIIDGTDILLSDIPFVSKNKYTKMHSDYWHGDSEKPTRDFIQPENESRLLLLALLTKRVKLLNQLITSLNAFMNICSTVVGTAPGAPLGSLNFAASQMVTTLNQLQANLEGTKSKYVKTA